MAAAAYNATWQYLDAVKRANSKDPDKVIKALEGHTYHEFLYQPGYIRPEDHLEMTNAFLLRVKAARSGEGEGGLFRGRRGRSRRTRPSLLSGSSRNFN